MASSERDSLQENGDAAPSGRDRARDERAERLARALRENLKRRKQQARARAASDKDASQPGAAPDPAD